MHSFLDTLPVVRKLWVGQAMAVMAARQTLLRFHQAQMWPILHFFLLTAAYIITKMISAPTFLLSNHVDKEVLVKKHEP